VIKASRNFICIRIDSYESEKAQKIVRNFLDGRFENTAFCLLAPDGKTKLSRSTRGPNQALGGNLASSLDQIAAKYKTKGNTAEAPAPDFPNFRLGLNVSSADQRALVLVTGTEKELKATRQILPAICNDPEVIGRLHYDFETDVTTWTAALTGDKSTSQIKIIVPDAYGQKGVIVKSLPLDTKPEALKKALLEANESFAKTTEKKTYNTHVQEGRRQGIKWTMPMEFGEDRDGDGKIDHRAGQGR
jgi:hypothetical protein